MAHGPLRRAILPIGAYEPRWFMRDQHMNRTDAVKALGDCGADQALRIITAPSSSPMRRSTRRLTALNVALDEAKDSAQAFCGAEAGARWRNLDVLIG